MSPRNDTFLSLCLSQAELSPLHYRHGSIIVRGGKVIGQGFNTYRPGFDGGALKSGVLPAGAGDGAAIRGLKERMREKTMEKFKRDDVKGNQQDAGATQATRAAFTPFESLGSGHLANTPLSMHSEMMAIRSALSLSSGTQSSQTSARAAAYYQKPCFKLPGDSKKRKARARGLKAYAEAVLAEAAPVKLTTGKVSGGKCSVQTQGFEPGTSQPGQAVQRVQQRVLRRGGGCGGAEWFRVYEREEEYCETPEPEEVRAEEWVSLPKKIPPIPTNPQQLLITKNKSLDSKPDIAARTKDLRLKGSDLYVARLGSCNSTRPLPRSKYKPPDPKPTPETPTPKSEPTSLYDELSPLSRTPSPTTTSSAQLAPSTQPEIRASRPCYRCVSAMHAVGIKRVFWTNADGEWEGAKVRDLVEALEMGDGEPGHGEKGEGGDKGVFVTKHEVLMLKRITGF